MTKITEAFKETEIGVIPDDWEVISLQQMLDDNTINGHLDGNHGGLYPKSNEFTDSGIPYISANCIKDGRIDFASAKYLPIERAKQFKKGVSHDGDVLFAHNATVGPVALLRTELDYVILSTTLTYYRCNTSKLVPEFLLYSMTSKYFRNQYEKIMRQSTRNQVPITAQRQFKHVIPPLSEQQRIAEILNTVDEYIEKLNKIIEDYQLLKRGMMKKLLTEGIGHNEFKETEIGRIPKTWEVRELGDVSYFKQGYQIPRTEQSCEPFEECVRYLYITDFFSDKSILYVQNKPEYYHIAEKDICIANTGNTCGKSFRGTKGLLSNNMFKIFADEEKICLDYYWQFLQSDFYWKQLTKYTNSAGQPHVGHKNMSILKITIPSILEQKQIASILSQIDNRFDLCQKQREDFKQLKNALLEKLLTGKIRVNQ